MKVNILNEKMNINPERVTRVTKQKFFEHFFRMIYIKDGLTLSDNEIKVMSTLCGGKTLQECGISKNNLTPVLKKLESKGLINGKDLSDYSKVLKQKFTDEVEIVFNYIIVDDDTG